MTAPVALIFVFVYVLEKNKAWTVRICNGQINVISPWVRPSTRPMWLFTSKRLLLLPYLLDNHKSPHNPRLLGLSGPDLRWDTKMGSWGCSVVLWLLAVTHWLVISYLTRHTLTNQCFLLSCYGTTRSIKQTNDAQLKMKMTNWILKKIDAVVMKNVIILMLQVLLPYLKYLHNSLSLSF